MNIMIMNMLIERSEQTKYLSIPFRMTVPLKKYNFTALFVSYKTESYITQDIKKKYFILNLVEFARGLRKFI